jgi:hypothetical protein
MRLDGPRRDRGLVDELMSTWPEQGQVGSSGNI